MKIIEFEELDHKHLETLTKYLLKKVKVSHDEVIEIINHTTNWCLENRATCYGIVTETKIVGTISLSKQDLKKKTASIGYEIFIEERNKKYATLALFSLLCIAKKLGFKVINAKVNKNNTFSLRIWKHYKTSINNLSDNQFMISLNLKENYELDNINNRWII